jgi:hypothetical protein
MYEQVRAAPYEKKTHGCFIPWRARASYPEIRGIVTHSKPVERAALLTLQLVRWSDGA